MIGPRGVPPGSSGPDPAAAGDDAARPNEHEKATQEPCDLCGAMMYGRHCRLICPQCGFQRDCSDP